MHRMPYNNRPLTPVMGHQCPKTAVARPQLAALQNGNVVAFSTGSQVTLLHGPSLARGKEVLRGGPLINESRALSRRGRCVLGHDVDILFRDCAEFSDAATSRRRERECAKSSREIRCGNRRSIWQTRVRNHCTLQHFQQFHVLDHRKHLRMRSSVTLAHDSETQHK